MSLSFSRLQSSNDKRVQPYVVFPPYNPVVVDPNPKEYETQVNQEILCARNFILILTIIFYKDTSTERQQ